MFAIDISWITNISCVQIAYSTVFVANKCYEIIFTKKHSCLRGGGNVRDARLKYGLIREGLISGSLICRVEGEGLIGELTANFCGHWPMGLRNASD